MPHRWKQVLTVWVVALCWAGSTAARAQEHRRADHVVLISVDGFRPDFYLDEDWPAPTIQQLAREGVRADRVRGVFPSVTYPSHTTLITGALPARHGVYYNRPFEPDGQTGRWYWDEKEIQLPTLWDAVKQAGGTTASVSWPVSVGAPIDWNVPEIWSLDEAAEPVAATRDATTPPGLLDEIEREATGRLTGASFGSEWISREQRVGAMAAYLLEQYRPTLLTVHLIATDHFQHEQGRDGPLVRRALAGVDAAIGQLLEAAERAGILDRTAFVITGDHGFVDVHTRVNPNVWLAEAGLIEPRDDRGQWRAAFHTAGGSTFLHLSRHPQREATLARMRSILDRLPAGERGLFRVLDRQQLDRVGADPAAMLALAAAPGIVFGDSPRAPLLQAATGGAHGFLMDFPEIYTGLVGWGAGFRPGMVAPVLNQADVAPLIAALLGMPLSVPDGVLPVGLLEQR